MLTKLINSLDERLKTTSLDLVACVSVVMYLAFKLSSWGMFYANAALTKGADLTGTAAVIAAVAGIPIGLLTLAINTYVKSWGNNDPRN